MVYYVVNAESRRSLFGPFVDRRDADNKHYEVCAHGITNRETGETARPKCLVVSEAAFEPNEGGNQFKHPETSGAKK